MKIIRPSVDYYKPINTTLIWAPSNETSHNDSKIIDLDDVIDKNGYI